MTLYSKHYLLFWVYIPVVLPINAQLLFNGDFERPTVEVNSIAYSTAPEDWSWNGATGGIINSDGSILPPANSGSQYALIGGYNRLDFNLVQEFSVPVSGTYRLNWADTTLFSGGPDSSEVNVTVEGVYSATFSTLHGSWTERSALFHLNSGLHTIRFSPAVNGGTDRGVDSVSLVLVPEVESATMISSLALLVMFAWRIRPNGFRSFKTKLYGY